MIPGEGTRGGKLMQMPALRALAYSDFRWLWFGAFFSFSGSQIQAVAQQIMVLDMTHSPAKLALVSFAMMVPISLFSPILGVGADMFDKRKLLILCMIVSAVGPLFLGVVGYLGHIQYWMFLAVASVLGFVQCVEVPTRQSIVRAVVSDRDLPSAVPMQASTFNLARIVGPQIGGLLALNFGAATCFIVNGISFFALAISALAIKTDLRPQTVKLEPIRDLVMEGFRFTFRNPGLRTLFILESATGVFGTFVMSQLSAIARHHLGLGVRGTTFSFTAIGVGALCGLILTGSLSAKPLKTLVVRFAMTGMALAVFVLGLVNQEWLAYCLFGCIGAFSIMQFNTTNTLFQLMSPPALRGRVISMHVWAIAGVAPLGVLAFGYISEWFGIRQSLMTGGLILAIFSAWGWFQSRSLTEPTLE